MKKPPIQGRKRWVCMEVDSGKPCKRKIERLSRRSDSHFLLGRDISLRFGLGRGISTFFLFRMFGTIRRRFPVVRYVEPTPLEDDPRSSPNEPPYPFSALGAIRKRGI